MKPRGIVTLLTDFGLEDAYVGAMKGAILAVHANLPWARSFRPGRGPTGGGGATRRGRHTPPTGTIAATGCLGIKGGRGLARAGPALRSLRQRDQQPAAQGAGSHQGRERDARPDR